MAIDPKIKAFLDLIGKSEGADYNILYGGSKFSDFSKHPNKAITAGGITSTAAGKYQFLNKTWVGVANRLKLKDFSPASQDAAAIQLLKDRKAYNLILNGQITEAIYLCSKEWASMPWTTGVSYYGQNSHTLTNLLAWYKTFNVSKKPLPSGQVA
jgi:muramidase (phage lysozyme)